MSSAVVGVQPWMEKGTALLHKLNQRKKELSIFTHCFVHSLNSGVGVAIKSSKIMKYAQETIHKITKLIKRSHRTKNEVFN